MVLEGADISRPVCALETYEKINKNLHKLSPQVMNSLLSYYHHARDIELLRKCIIEQQNNPQEIDRILVREFLRTIYDGTQLIPPLLLELKDSGRGG